MKPWEKSKLVNYEMHQQFSGHTSLQSKQAGYSKQLSVTGINNMFCVSHSIICM